MGVLPSSVYRIDVPDLPVESVTEREPSISEPGAGEKLTSYDVGIFWARHADAAAYVLASVLVLSCVESPTAVPSYV